MLLASKGKEGGAAAICVISSVAGTNPSPSIGIYSMTKAALDNMVKMLSKELMPDGIRICGLAPGLIRTEFSSSIWNRDEVDQSSVGESHHIGSVAALLCSPKDGGFCNGEIFLVNGGFAKI